MGGVGKVLSPITSILGGGDTRGSVTPPPAQPAPAEAPVPMSDDESSRKARKRAVATAQARSGRASTILTDFSGDKLG